MCRFYGLQIFSTMHDLGVDAFMRVDDDVLFLGAVSYDPFQWMFETGNIFVYGTAVNEDHDITKETFGSWVFELCSGINWGWTHVDCGALTRKTFETMFFNNVFATRTAFWLEAPVERLLWEIDRTSRIYTHRWGDAPIQTAAVRLFAPTGSLLRCAGTWGDGHTRSYTSRIGRCLVVLQRLLTRGLICAPRNLPNETRSSLSPHPPNLLRSCKAACTDLRSPEWQRLHRVRSQTYPG